MANTEPRTMEEYIPLHAKRYQDLVARFDIATGKKASVNKPDEQSANVDVAVVARLRPLLEAELDSGFPQGFFCRPNAAGVLDAHELKRPIRGPPILPTLQVSCRPAYDSTKHFPARHANRLLSQSSHFQVDQAFGPDASTEALYDAFVKPLVNWAWSGGVGTLFAYGQTGSGKTYTVSQLERMAVQTLMSGELEGSKNCYITIFELAGNSAYGESPLRVLDPSLPSLALTADTPHPMQTF
jgi:kinesin family member 2/24